MTRDKAKTVTTGRNDSRRSGKKWKGGKSPEVRETERRAAVKEKAERKFLDRSEF